MSDELEGTMIEDMEELEEILGANLTGIEEVANKTKVHFAELCQEEDLNTTEMMTAWELVKDHVDSVIRGELGA